MIQIFNGRERARPKMTEYKNDMILPFSGTLNTMVAFFSFHDAFLRDLEHIENITLFGKMTFSFPDLVENDFTLLFA